MKFHVSCAQVHYDTNKSQIMPRQNVARCLLCQGSLPIEDMEVVMSHMEQQHRAYHNLAFMLAAMGLTQAGIEDTIGFMNNYSDIDIAEDVIDQPFSKTEKNEEVKSETGKVVVEIIKKEEKKTEDKWMDQKNFEFNNIQLERQNTLEERKTNLKKYHYHKNLDNNGQIKCGKCDESFSSMRKRSFHYGIAHSKPGKVVPHCVPCEKRFPSQERLMKHLKRARNHFSASDICHECGFTSSVKQTLQYHVKHAHDDVLYTCNLCSKEFKGRQSLRIHSRRFHEHKKVSCSFCGKMVKQIKHHIASRHTKNEDQRHKCQFCEKGFFCKDKLRDHENIHTGNKPYKCRVAEGWCSYSCADHGNRSKHEILCRKRWIKSETNVPEPKAD